jgi:hypothetical protein
MAALLAGLVMNARVPAGQYARENEQNGHSQRAGFFSDCQPPRKYCNVFRASSR